MESTRSTSSLTSSDTALAASTSDSKQKTAPTKPSTKKASCSLGHSGHTDKQCRVRKFRDMEREMSELKKDWELKSKPEQAQTATTNTMSPSYWDHAFSCYDSPSILTEIADTGASSHMYKDESKFDNLEFTPPVSISIASKDGSISATKKGQVTIDSLTLKDVLHSKELSSNLISIGKFCNEGHVAIFCETSGSIIDPHGKQVMLLTRGPSADRLWHLVSRNTHQTDLATRTDGISMANIWHRRLGHLHPDGVMQFLKTIGTPAPSQSQFLGCDGCLEGKSTQSPSTSSFHHSPHVLSIVHSDLLGSISPYSRTGKTYILSLINDHTW